MKKIFLILTACLMAVSMMAKSKMTFVVSGPEEKYNQIRVINETSLTNITCRVVVVDDKDKVMSVYGVYNLGGWNSSDTNTNTVWRGTKLGVQMPTDFDGELSFDVEYRDLPLFDIVIIHLRDKGSGFKDQM